MNRTSPSLRRIPRCALMLILLLASPVATSAGSVPPLLWVAHFDGAGEPFSTDVFADLAVNAAGEICATGGSVVSGGAFAAATVFYEADGSERWRHRYVAPDSGGNDQGLKAFLDDAGYCRVTGQRSVADPSGPDVLVLEYDPQGELRWSASYDGAGSGFDSGIDVTADAAGNVYVLGLVTGDGTDWDFVTLKYDDAGNELWARTFDGPAQAEDRPVGLAVDAEANVYVAGTAAVNNPFGDDFVVIKYDPDGNALWTELFDGGVGGTDRAAALALDAAGHPYVGGLLLPPPGNEWHAAVVKLLPDGSHDWSGLAGHPAAGIPEQVRGLAVDAAGSAYIAFTGSNDVLVARFDPAGTPLWDHLYDSVSLASNAVRPLALDAAGNAYVAAYDFVPGSGNDFLTYRLDAADGALAWAVSFGEEGETADDFTSTVAVDSRGHILVGGTVRPGGASFVTDWAIVKYAAVLFADGFESGDLSAWSSSTN